ncbi:hypothetical protein OEJ37_08930 [Burkholderia sp. BKH01]|uniref:hypothetical protein n=1 Tax=Burkholderia sp. BKH01 TaxID=2769262 RepID=UPI0021DFCEC6|nr:hypothetical protein [Burkholderia sp. BKH01]MCU9953483.1 hypothetical protein [Burkholderia sp. BKH01]
MVFNERSPIVVAGRLGKDPMKPESNRLDTRRAFRAGCEGGAEGRADVSIMRPDFAGVASDRGPAAATP